MQSRENVGLVLTIEELINTDVALIVNKLQEYIEHIGYKKSREENTAFNQRDAWNIEIRFLQQQLRMSSLDRNTFILLEYMLPGENTERPDALILLKNELYSLEFKTIGKIIKKEYATQFIDYKTILNEYHQQCIESDIKVHSNLIMCNCNEADIMWEEGVRNKLDDEDIAAVIGCDKFQDLLSSMLDKEAMNYDEVNTWINSKRARSKKIWDQGLEIKNALVSSGTSELYSKVKTIPYSDLRAAQDKINDLLKNDEKQIIFVSGVPGAGKTLIGMLTLFGALGDRKRARYYTGNGALKDVLSNLMDCRDISIFTSFRRNFISGNDICNEQVLIFDEAQRFWDGITNKLGYTDAQGVLNARYGQNVSIVCLIGNGQKPMSGEAGIEAWIEPLKSDHSWKVYAPKIHEHEFEGVDAMFYEDLYLNVAKRQHFVDLSKWVEAVLKGDLEKAKRELEIINSEKAEDKFGILLTRSLSNLYSKNSNGKCKLEQHKVKRGRDYLFGLLCSSKNKMEEMAALTNGIIWQKWNSSTRKYDTNTYIENKDAHKWYDGECCNTDNIKIATETFCQGLEVDLPIIFFGGDYLVKKNGDKFERVINPSNYAKKKYGDEIENIMEDTYRILLTRATEEMIIVIPETLDHRFDDTFNFFKGMGIKVF